MDFDNKLTSYICGANTWFDFCINGIGSDCDNYANVNSGAGYTVNGYMKYLDNTVSSVRLGPYDPNRIGAATLFEDFNCRGASGRFYWDPEDLPEEGTDYNYTDLLFAGMRDNYAHSIRVPKGYVVELYRDNDFTDLQQTIVGRVSENDRREFVCEEILDEWKVSSLKIRRDSHNPIGYWKSVPTTGKSSATIEVGLRFTEVDSANKPKVHLTKQIKELDEVLLRGVKFEGVTLNDRMSEGIRRDVGDIFL